MAELTGELLDRLRCPITKAPVVADGDWIYGTHPEHRFKYPVRGGVPVMTPAAAVTVAKDEFDDIVARAQQSPPAS